MVDPFLPAPVLTREQRHTHAYVIGQPGTGKSRLLESWIMQDIRAGEGVCLIDPHGDLFQHVMANVADIPQVWEKVVVVDPLDPHWAVPFNPLHIPEGTTPERIAWFLSDIILKIWKLERTQAPRMTWMMANTFTALADLKLPITATARFLTDPFYRSPLIDRLRNDSVRDYFLREFPQREEIVREWVSPLLNKLGSFLQDPDISAMFTHANGINMLELMDKRCIILVQIPKGLLGENTSNLLGAFIVAQIQQAALSRKSESERRPFYLYLDEFQNYTTDNISDILSESRKYQLSMVLAHQYLQQLDEEIRAAVLNTSGAIACFRTGFDDALHLAKHVFPTLDFQVKSRTRIGVTTIRSMLFPTVREEKEHQDWDGLAYRISGQKQREFWVRVRSQEQPLHLRSHDVPDPTMTTRTARRVQDLVDTSGRRYARLKRSQGESNHGNEQTKTDQSGDMAFWSR